MNHTARRWNGVLLLLSVVGIAGAVSGALVTRAPNRLVSGTPFPLWTQIPVSAIDSATVGAIIVLGVGLLLTAFARPTPMRHRLAGVSAFLVLLLVLIEAGWVAQALVAGAAPATRISLGAGFWILEFCASLILVDALQRLRATPLAQFGVVAAAIVAVGVLAGLGVFSDLSIMREYASRRGVFARELVRHVLLVLGAVATALAIGIPLGLQALSRPRFRRTTFAVLNVVQTIPSLALFAFLIAPLAWLGTTLPALQAVGIQGIGIAPAWIALTGYALLPIVRNTYEGFAGVQPAAIEAARGLGFTRGQRRLRIELPLALPALLAGLRLVLVQTIGLAVVAALIGAGGLGTFVFQGIGQYATDLVLLGVLPTIFLALAADFLLALAQTRLPMNRATA